MEYTSHYSVMLNECLEYLGENFDNDRELVFVDCTFGGGGHTSAMLERFPNAKVYSFDQDPDAVKNGNALLEERGFSDRCQIIQTNFENAADWFAENLKDVKLSGVLMDLGVSSHHFDEASRGFSFRHDAPLDMRMAADRPDIKTAAEVLNTLSEEDIANIIFEYGEERLSRKIAREIVSYRQKEKLETTKQLENIVFHCYPAKQRHSKIHPATKTFQALRIYVNRELEVLENSMEDLFNLLEENGRLAIISFHSLEDRIVKHKYKEISQNYPNAAKIITKKPVLPTQQEVDENSRSRSAKLRILEKNFQGVGSGKKNKYKDKSKLN
jgi:16S rRNA (cytosine1402-N4)-methyltransferase